jgi:hypothetical protein
MDSASANNLPIKTNIKPKLASISLLPSTTNLFTSIHTRSLNINFENVRTSNEILEPITDREKLTFDSSLLIKNLKRNELTTIDENDELLNTLNDEEKSMAIYLNKVILHDPFKVSIRESFTNNFLDFLLNKLEFNKYPFVLNLQPRYTFDAESTKIVSRPDFSVEKADKQICLIFLDETKHVNNIKLENEFGECHLAGDFIAASFSNYSLPCNKKFLRDQTLYGVRVIGTRFTFYKCQAKMSYLSELEQACMNPLESLNVSRYPANNYGDIQFGYDFSNSLHRVLIIELLIQLREQIRKM